MKGGAEMVEITRSGPGQFVQETRFCDFGHPAVHRLAEELDKGNEPRELAKAAFTLVREKIVFGFDLWQVKASDTVQKGYGMCSNKALVLVALLRHHGIPSRLAYYPIKRDALGPAWGRMQVLMARVLHHVIAEVLLDEKWIPVDLTLDTSTYERLFLPSGVKWGIDWDGSEPCILFKEHIMGPVVSYTVVDEALQDNAGNRAPPKFLGESMMTYLNKKLWPRVRGASA
jgi:transglutaminase-like putative cysteine protease